MTASEELASFITRLTYDDLPSGVVTATKRFLTDTLGVGLSGSTSAQGQAIQSFLADAGGPEEATVIGTRLKTSRLNAALANGIHIRAREMEDTFEQAFFHSGPGAIGGPLALVERERPTGKELLTAVAVGYEVGVRIAISVSPSHAVRRYHATGTCGSFGAAAAIAKLMGMTEPQIVSALGIAGLQAAGVMQGVDPAWRYLTGIDGGRAAHLGITAALLARHGFPASPDIFEAPYGFCAMHADTFDASLITRGLGTDYMMPSVGIKLFPASRPTHASISAGIMLRESHNIDPEEIAEVSVRGISGAMISGNKPDPESELDAQGSQQYTVSVALTRGNFTLEDVTPEAVTEPAIRRLMGKFTVAPDPDLDAERLRDLSTWPTVVEVRMNDGTNYSQRVVSPPGSAQNPPSPQQLEDKYMYLTTRVLPEQQARDLWNMVGRLDQQNDLASFIRLWELPV